MRVTYSVFYNVTPILAVFFKYANAYCVRLATPLMMTGTAEGRVKGRETATPRPCTRATHG